MLLRGYPRSWVGEGVGRLLREVSKTQEAMLAGSVSHVTQERG